MKSNHQKLLLAFASVLTLASPSFSQETAGTTGLVTVLDVAKVFDQNPAFKQQMESIKSEATTLKEQIEAEQTQIRNDAQELQDLEVGSPERQKLEADLTRRQAELQNKARQSEQNLLNREAGIYYDTYMAMQEVVNSIAQENGIGLVIRYDSTTIDKTSRPEVIKGVNRTVVFHHKLDLTNLVSKRMNARTASSGTGNLK